MTEAEWLAGADAGAMLAHVLGRACTARRAQLVVVACGDLIRDGMAPRHRAAFEALGRAAEGAVTPECRRLVRRAVALPDWLGWVHGAGGGAPELHAATAALVREVFGNPFRPVAFPSAWRTATTVAIANRMYESRDFGAMPALADALQDAGCDCADVLDHCRDPKGAHVRGCWVVDRASGRG